MLFCVVRLFSVGPQCHVARNHKLIAVAKPQSRSCRECG